MQQHSDQWTKPKAPSGFPPKFQRKILHRVQWFEWQFQGRICPAINLCFTHYRCGDCSSQLFGMSHVTLVSCPNTRRRDQHELTKNKNKYTSNGSSTLWHLLERSLRHVCPFVCLKHVAALGTSIAVPTTPYQCCYFILALHTINVQELNIPEIQISDSIRIQWRCCGTHHGGYDLLKDQLQLGSSWTSNLHLHNFIRTCRSLSWALVYTAAVVQTYTIDTTLSAHNSCIQNGFTKEA